MLSRYAGLRDVFLLMLAGAAAAGIVAFLVGFLLARYRDIFFAMLSLAMSMILYGVLVKTETLGSTDGFHVEPGRSSAYEPRGRALNRGLFWLVLGSSRHRLAGAPLFPHRRRRARCRRATTRSAWSSSASRSRRVIHLKLVISGTLAGLGGALAALAVAHVDPNMAYWTTSGGFVFVTILAGAGSVAAASWARWCSSCVRSIAIDLSPGIWQIILGSALLLTILFLPEGLGSLFHRLRRTAETG